MKRDHVFLYVDVEGVRTFRGFLTDRATAEAWVKKQDNPGDFEISDDPPPRKEAVAVVDATAASTDRGMAKALAAVKEAKDGA